MKADKRTIWLRVVLAVIVALLGLWGIQYCYYPSIVADELGYWAGGAFLNGLDWSGLLQSVPSYGVGYGFLLAPFFLFRDPVWAYHGAIVLNVVMLEGVFFLANRLAKRLFGEANPTIRILAAFAVAIYPYNLFYAKYTMSEIVLTFFFWLFLYQMVEFFYKQTPLRAVLLALNAIYLYAVHMRVLGVVGAAVLILLLAAVRRDIPRKQFLVFLLAAAVAFGGLTLYKRAVMNKEYTAPQGTEAVEAAPEEEAVDVNSFGAQLGKFGKLLTPTGILNFMCGMAGRLFYLGCASFLVFYWAARRLIMTSLRWIRRKNSQSPPIRWANETEPSHELERVQRYVYPFLLLSILFSLMISTLSMIDPARIDTVMYGRYVECFIGPVLLLGIFELRRTRNGLVWEAGLSLMQVGFAAVLYQYILQYGLSSIGENSIVGIWGFPRVLGMVAVNRYTFFVCLLSIAGGFLILLVLGGSEQRRTAGLVVLAAFWGLIGFNVSSQQSTNAEGQQLEAETAANVRGLAQGSKLWYFYDEGQPARVLWNFCSLQFLYGNQELGRIDAESMDKMGPEDLLLVNASADTTGAKLDDCTTLLQQSSYMVYAKSGSTHVGTFLQQALDTEPVEVSFENWTIASGGRICEQQSDGSWEELYQQPEPTAKILDGMETPESADAVNAAPTPAPTMPKIHENKVYSIETPDISLAAAGQNGGYVASGPGNLSIKQPGSYEVAITLQLLNPAEVSGSIGQCEVYTTSGGVLSARKIDAADLQSGAATTLTMNLYTPQEKGINNLSFRLLAYGNARYRILGVSYHMLSNQRQAVAGSEVDMQAVMAVVRQDPDNLPICVLTNTGNRDMVSTDALQGVIDSQQHDVRLLGVEDYQSLPACILLLPVEQEEIMQELLDNYVIVSRLTDYVLMIPANSSVETKYRDGGGYEYSRGKALSLRYYAGNGGYSPPASMQAALPAGVYEIEYALTVDGGGIYNLWDVGTLTFTPTEGDPILIAIREDTMEGNVLQGSTSITLQQRGSLNVRALIRGEVNISQVDIFLTRTGDAPELPANAAA